MPKSSRCFLALLCLGLTLAFTPAHGAFFLTWDGGGSDDFVNTANNWDLNQSPATGDLLTFGGSVRTSPNLSAGLEVGSVTFALGASAFTMGGSGLLSVQTGGIVNQAATTQTVNPNLKLTGTGTRTFNAFAGALVFGGALDKNAKALVIDGSFNTTFSGVISGSATMEKTGSGTLTFSGAAANTYSGATTVTAGTLVLNKSAGVNALAGDLTIGDGSGGSQADVVLLSAANQIPDNKQLIIESSGFLDLNGFSEGIATSGSPGATTIKGGSILTRNGTLTVGKTLTFSNGGGTIDTGTGDLVLGSNGGTTVNGNDSGAIITISGNRVNLGGVEQDFATDTGVAMTISSQVINGSVQKSGGGDLILTGANTYASGTQILTGSLHAGHDQALGTGSVELNGGGELRATGGARTLANNFSITGTGDHTFGGSEQITITGTTTLSGGDRTLQVDNSQSTIFSGTITEDAPSRLLTKQGSGNLVLSSANTFTGGLSVDEGTVTFGNNAAAGTGTLTLDVSTVRAQASTTPTLANAVTVAGNVTFAGSDALSFSGPVTLTGNRTFTIDSSAAVTFSGAMGQNSGSRILTKAGSGNLILSGANTHAGGTTLNAGTLTINNTSGSGTGTGAVTVNAGATLAGTGTASGAVTVNGTVAPGVSPGTLTTGSETWNAGGAYRWEINGVNAGEGVGHDKISISGTLTISATSMSKFTLDVNSLTAGNASGNVPDFNSATSYSWRVASTTDGITGFDTTKFDLNSDDFSNPLNGGSFSLTIENSDRDLYVNFNSVPEPAASAWVTALLLLGASSVRMWVARRTR